MLSSVRSQGKPTVPSVLGDELACNPFLQPRDANIRKTLNIPENASDVDAFAAIR